MPHVDLHLHLLPGVHLRHAIDLHLDLLRVGLEVVEVWRSWRSCRSCRHGATEVWGPGGMEVKYGSLEGV
jgi:hypothetical protein